jgi:hypothetical protein
MEPKKEHERELAVRRTVVPSVIVAAGEQATREFLAYFSGLDVNEDTRVVYRSTVRRFFRWAEARGLTLEGIHQDHMREFLEGLSRLVLQQVLPILRRFFNHLVNAGIVHNNPVASLKASAIWPTVEDLQDILLEADPSLTEDCDAFQAQLVLLAGVFRGNKDLEALSRFTGVSLDVVQQYAANLREAGVWTEEGYTCCNWHEPDGLGDIEFVIHAMVALGEVQKVGDDRYIHVRQARAKG